MKRLWIAIALLLAALPTLCDELCTAMYLSGRKIGTSIVKSSPGYFEGKAVTDTYTVTRARFKNGGVLINSIESETCYTDNDGKTLFRRINSRSSDGTFAKTEVRYTAEKIFFKTETRDGKTEKTFDIPKDLPFDIDPLDRYIEDTVEGEARSYEYYTFDTDKAEILKMKDTLEYIGDSEVEAAGKKYECAVIKGIDKNGHTSYSYISGGEVVKSELPDESVMVVIDLPENRDKFDDYDMTEESKIASDVKIEDPEKVIAMSGSLTNTATGKVTAFDNKAIIMNPAESLPYPVKGEDKYLKATTIIDCDNPEIIAFAKKHAAGAKNSYEACDKLKEAVFELMDFEESGTEMQKAGDILKSGKGVCRHASLLYTALVRSLGIPCRQVLGIAYIPDGDGFGGHAWAECYVGKWVPFDPTWNSDFVDATHIKLAESEVDDAVTLFDMTIKIDKVEVMK